jgi:hypothetical protein
MKNEYCGGNFVGSWETVAGNILAQIWHACYLCTQIFIWRVLAHTHPRLGRSHRSDEKACAHVGEILARNRIESVSRSHFCQPLYNLLMEKPCTPACLSAARWTWRVLQKLVREKVPAATAVQTNSTRRHGRKNYTTAGAKCANENKSHSTAKEHETFPPRSISDIFIPAAHVGNVCDSSSV